LGRIPQTHAQLDDLGVKDTATVHGITGGGSGHLGRLRGARVVGACPRMRQNPTTGFGHAVFDSDNRFT